MGVWFNDQPYTSFRNVNAKKGRVRLTDGDGSGYSAVLEALSLSADRTISIRNVSGSLMVGLAGTLSVNLEDVAAGEYYATVVTITGLTSNDAISWCMADSISGSAQLVPAVAIAATDAATLVFANFGLASTGAARDVNINYTVIRL